MGICQCLSLLIIWSISLSFSVVMNTRHSPSETFFQQLCSNSYTDSVIVKEQATDTEPFLMSRNLSIHKEPTIDLPKSLFNRHRFSSREITGINNNNGTDISVSPSLTPEVVYGYEKWKWSDIVNYDMLADAIIPRLHDGVGLQGNYFIVYHVDSTVGFANQFRSLVGVFLLALVSGRKLRIDWEDYFNVTDSYFRVLKFTRLEVKHRQFKIYTKFPRGLCNDTKYDSHNVSAIFGNRHLSFNILSDLSCLVLPRFVFTENGVDQTISSAAESDIRRQLTRLLLVPNGEITHLARRSIRNLNSRYTIGVQLRMGGGVSNTQESHRFLYLSSFTYVYEEIVYAIKTMHWSQSNTTVFLTTDSDMVRLALLRILPTNVTLITTNEYKSGHSSSYHAYGNNHVVFLKRAVLDLIIISHCDYILFTHGSSYGSLGSHLSFHVPSRRLCRDQICVPFM